MKGLAPQRQIQVPSTSPQPSRLCLGSAAADNAGVAGDDQGGRAPAECLEEPAAGGDPLADGGGGVEIAAGADVGLEQRQAEVDAQADLFDGGAELAVIGGEAVAPGGSVAVVRQATY